MTDEDKKKAIMNQAGELLDAGYHCSETVLLAVGGHYLKEIPPQAVRMATPFAGGVGESGSELCGALTGGLMVIGGLKGRTEAGVNDGACQALAAECRARFLERFGWSRCQDLKDHWIGIVGQESCRALVEQAAGLLMKVIEGMKMD